jgi:hypothetical protein
VGVAIYAIAMAWLEAAVVMYLRVFTDRVQPYQVEPLPLLADLGNIELVREVATLVMLLCVGWLAGRSFKSRVGYFLITFGIWDILYYFFLRIMGGWPATLLDWDILFLLPLPWWGPVLAPMLIAGQMILLGTLLAVQGEERVARGLYWAVAGLGASIALVVFMRDAILLLPHGLEAVIQVLPERFLWGPFLLALGLLSAPIISLSIQSVRPALSAKKVN